MALRQAGIILMFIGVKMLVAFVDVHFSIEATLLFVLGTLGAAVAYSLYKDKERRK
jgi:predicted tellurium resistance membrane protein TerC